MTADPGTPLVSVIIPTFNRAGLLGRSLDSLTRQTIPKENFEVVVVDDGSSDETGESARSYRDRLRLKVFRIENSGISAAKNLGIFAADAPILLFFDDDDAADPDMLREHLATHAEHPAENVAVLGYTTWSPDLAVTPVMHYVTDVGQFLFSYGNLSHGQSLDFTCFWGGRSSCKRSFLVRHGIFNQDFRFGSEDIELGYRLSKFGLRVIYNRKAVSRMIRPLTYDEFCRRCEKQGKSQVLFARLHPDPAIRRYCMTDEAETKWPRVSAVLGSKVARARELEARLALAPEGERGGETVAELFDLCGWTFNAFKIKGIVEERMRTSDPLSPPGPGRAHILFVLRTPPQYDRASGALRHHNLLRILKEKGHRVTFAAVHSRTCDGVDLAPYMERLRSMGIDAIGLDTLIERKQDGVPYDTGLAFRSLLHRFRFDVALLPFYGVARNFVPHLRAVSPWTRIVVDSVDLHFLREGRQLREEGGPASAWIGWSENRMAELNLYRSADAVLTVTDQDRLALAERMKAPPVLTVPDPHRAEPSVPGYDERSDIVFVAGFRHAPNADAVLYFHREIWPDVARRLPETRWFIVGDGPPPHVQALASDRIVVTGYVPELAPYLRRARVNIAPLRFGAGMKGKIAVGLAQGLPCVTTAVGAEGLGVVHGKDILIADTPSEFADAIERLMKDRDAWNSLSAAGRALIDRRYGDDRVYRMLSEALDPDGTQEKEGDAPSDTLRDVEAIARGYRALSDGFVDAAEEIFADCFAGDPDNGWAATGFALAKGCRGRFGEAMGLMQSALSKSKRPGNAMAALGKICLLANQPEKAEECFRNAARIEPENWWPVSCRAERAADGKDFASAAKLYGRLVELLPGDIDAVLWQASLLLAIGDGEGYRVAESAAIARDPNLNPAYFRRILQEFVDRHPETFGEAFPAGEGGSPAAAVPAIPSGREDPRSEGTAHKKAKRYAEALEAFGRARESGDDSVLADMGDCLAQQGNVDDAEGMYMEALRIDPEDPRALVGMGIMAILKGDPSIASGFFGKALLSAPGDSTALCGLGMARGMEGRIEEGFAFHQKALDADPTNATALHELTKIAYELGRPREAESRLKGFLMYYPADPHILFALAGLLYREGRWEEAADRLERLEIVSPGYEGADELKGMIASKMSPV